MGKKRKSLASSLDEVDRSMYSTFCNGANAISQLYSQAMNHQKISFQSGERHGLVYTCFFIIFLCLYSWLVVFCMWVGVWEVILMFLVTCFVGFVGSAVLVGFMVWNLMCGGFLGVWLWFWFGVDGKWTYLVFFFRVFGLRLLECLIVRCVDVLFVGC